MNVSTNLSAMIANRELKRTDNRLADSLEKLSSGLKVNHAKDNPAGIAIAKRMNAQITGLGMARDNSNDGISIVETADGALSEIHAILQRMNELAVQSANGVNTTSDRESIDIEMKQLKEEIGRIAKSTEFNGKNILGGDFDLKGYTDNNDVKVRYYSDETPAKHYAISGATTHTDADGNLIVDDVTFTTGTGDTDFPAGAYFAGADGNIATIKGDNGFEVKLEIKGNVGAVDLDITGIGAMRMQIGANEGQVLEMRIPEISTKLMGIEDMKIDTAEDSKKAIDSIKNALEYVSKARSRLGAYQNRLERAAASLDTTSEKMTASYSRIMDVDMATEMTEYSTATVLSQAGTSMLAQANERPQQILTLLQ